MRLDFGKFNGQDIESVPLQYLDWLVQRYGPLVDHCRIRLQIPISAAERRRIAELKLLAKQALRRHPDNEPLVGFISNLLAIYDIRI